MTRDEIYKQISKPVAGHPVLEHFEVRTSKAAAALSKVDLCAVNGAKYAFDYVETSLVLPNEVVVPQLVTGLWWDVVPPESFVMWGGHFFVNGRTIVAFAAAGTSDHPYRLSRPVLIRPGDMIKAVFEGPTVEAGAIQLRVRGFEITYSVLPDVAHFAEAS